VPRHQLQPEPQSGHAELLMADEPCGSYKSVWLFVVIIVACLVYSIFQNNHHAMWDIQQISTSAV
jgi:hypothetical protein